MIPKSKGHIGFTENFEYFQIGDNIFRASISDCMDIYGYRSGRRFESTIAAWESLKQFVEFVAE